LAEETKKVFLTYPDKEVCIFGETLHMWLVCLIIWGEVKITRKRPHENTYKVMSGRQFLAYTDTQAVNAICGEWRVDETVENRMRFYRIDFGISGTEVIEELVVDVSWDQD